MKIYSSLSRKKEEFVPLDKKQIRIYACGITPYDEIHIGHARQAVVYDVIRAYFQYLGYNVVYVRNFTDVDDKIIKRANQEGKESIEVSGHFIQESIKDLDVMKVRPADHEPKVTECIPDIIKFIQVLIDKGFAYVNNGEVFFEIDKFAEYGKLSNRKKEDLVNSEESENKKNSNDFVLWKPHKPGEPSWNSPWSEGRPGWHIECSVMAHKYLGEQIDIHGGGVDLIFPHHENELAQSEAYSGKQFAKYWVHNGLVMVDGTKMSKSLGNFMTVKEALDLYTPEEIRYVILSQSLSSNVDFTKDLFLNARKRVYYFYSTLAKIKFLMNEAAESQETEIPIIVKSLEEKFVEYMDDNFNTPRVISELSEVFKELNKIIDSKDISLFQKRFVFEKFFEQFKKITLVIRLFDESPDDYLSLIRKRILKESDITEEFIEQQLKERQEAKKNNDYDLADKIKNELIEKRISVKDYPDRVVWDILID